MANPETKKTGRGREEIIQDEINAALRAFRTSDFEARLRGRIRAESEPSGRTLLLKRRRSLVWAGVGLILISVISIGVWMRSRAARSGTAIAAIETTLAGSPYLQPGPTETQPAIRPKAALPGSLQEAIETSLSRALRSSPSATRAEHASPALKPVSPEELDRKIGDLFKGRKLELFFSEYLKNEEDV